MSVLNPAHYTVAWIAPLAIEARAALYTLDNRHKGKFALSRGDDYIFLPGDACGHNIIIATLPDGQEYGNGSAAAIASQVKKFFPNLWFGLLVGVAAGLPNFSRLPPLDIRLGDVLVGSPEGDSPALVAYDLGKETEAHGFQPLHGGRILCATETVVRSAIGCIKLEAPNDADLFLPFYENIKNKEHSAGKFIDPGQENDMYYHVNDDGVEYILQREPRPASRRTRVWYGPLGSGEKLMKNARKRNELRDRYNIIGLEMEAAGTMNSIAVGVIRGVCDYGDEHKNKDWQPYAAAMAAAYAKAVLSQITPEAAMQRKEAEAQSGIAKAQTSVPERLLEQRSGTEAKFPSPSHRVEDLKMQPAHSFTREPEIGTLTKELLRSLAFNQIGSRYYIEPAFGKTCQWLLKTPEFRDWLDPEKLDEHHGFLWIKGKPGAGKSTLMDFAWQHFPEAKRSDNILCFFFHPRGDDLEKSITGMYRSLLLQVFDKIPRLRHVLNCFRFTIKDGGIPNWTTQHLKTLFSQAVQDLRQSPLTLFIDALDECDEDQIRDMVEYFQDIAEKTRQKCTMLRVCFASRHYPQITIEKGIHLDVGSQEGHHEDISIYVKRKLRIGQDAFAQRIQATLIEKASGVFTWVVLVVKILQKVYDGGYKHELEGRLQKIPQRLHDLFRGILTQDGTRQNELLCCIQWVLFARRPLGPRELRQAIICGVAPDRARDWLCEKIGENEIRRFIIDCSKGFAETTKYTTVQFTHQSVRDYLLEHESIQILWPDAPERFKGKSQERLSQCCLDFCHAMFPLYSRMKKSLRAESQRKRPLDSRDLRSWKEALFLKYAVQNVLYHADAAEGAGIDQGQFLASFPLHHWIKLKSLVLGMRPGYGENTSLLYILSEYNAANLIKRCAENLNGFKKEEGQFGLPILVAFARGHDQAVLALMEAHAINEPLRDICQQYPRSVEIGSISYSARMFWSYSETESVFTNLVRAGNALILDFALTSGQVTPTAAEWNLFGCTNRTEDMIQVHRKHGPYYLGFNKGKLKIQDFEP
ncbi:NB-ARC and ankyrin domain [Cordyceps militaris]|uniref:NB-ARC and ankyrin domain n=1 Tax=Cordyceps militaris TaxID=73501 RepID=A0A2H4SVN8_CORMI|nr:NB-ARC and ankyrin domain [Cordyceps militaris]